MNLLKNLFSTTARAARSLINRSWRATKRAAADLFHSVCDGVAIAWCAAVRPLAELAGASEEALDRVEATGLALRDVVAEAAARTAAILEADVRELWDEVLDSLRAAAVRLAAVVEESWDQVLCVLEEALDELRGRRVLVVVEPEETPPTAAQVAIPL